MVVGGDIYAGIVYSYKQRDIVCVYVCIHSCIYILYIHIQYIQYIAI